MKQIGPCNFRVQTNNFEIYADWNGLEMSPAKVSFFKINVAKGTIFVKISPANGTTMSMLAPDPYPKFNQELPVLNSLDRGLDLSDLC